MMKTIRGKLISFFITIVIGLLVLGFALNTLYLEDFYVYKNKGLFLDVKQEITKLYGHDKQLGKRFMEQIDQQDSINCIIVNENLEVQFVTPRTKANQDQKRLPKEMEAFVVAHKQTIGNKVVYDTIKKEDKEEAKMIMIDRLPTNELLILTKAMKDVQESAIIANQFYLIAGGCMMALGILVIIILSKRITGPIVEMSQVAEHMAQLDFEKRIVIQSHDELGKLGESINELSEKLSTTMDTLQEDIEKKKQLVRNMSHELKTPIGIIKGYTEGLQYGVADDQEKRERYCQVIVQECDQMDYIVRQLLQLSHMNEMTFQLHKTSIEVERLVEEVIERFTPELEKKDICVSYEKTGGLAAELDVQLIEQVLSNFMTNAINHIEGERAIRIVTKQVGKDVVMSVFNTGRPIPEKDLEHVWDVFYKVDKARTRRYGGHGIGLSIVKQIAELHGGQVAVENKEDGVLFMIQIPLFHKHFSKGL